MTTLTIDQTELYSRACRGSEPLRDWLGGSWALLFSDPDHFAPNATTPKGYLTCLASVLTDNGIKLLELKADSPRTTWIDESDPQRGTLVLDLVYQDRVLDLRARQLLKKIQSTARPFVIVLDETAQCRTTVKYRPENITRPRTLEDIVETIYVLRGDEPASVSSHKCDQEPSWRIKTW